MSTRKGPGAANYLMSMAGTGAEKAAQSEGAQVESAAPTTATAPEDATRASRPQPSPHRTAAAAGASAADAPVLRMALALTPENAKYLEVVRMVKKTNKTALVNEAIEAMRRADTEYAAMCTAYETISAFRK